MDKYIGDILIDNCYETFDGHIIYIDKLHDNYAVVYETERDRLTNWRWNLRTMNYLRENIRTVMEVY